ncbi:MAG TPA: D-2-hydroxyacid dehydrogenase [Pseudolabrys sp.]|nr:D-2-hydroxyacid dehydrogenase [Pseudolabrys sp.]
MNVLILEANADHYAERLRQACPGLTVHPVETVYAVKDLETLPVKAAAIDVLIAFGISVNDELMRRAVNLKWIQSLATGVDHFTRCPSLRSEVLLTSARGIHGPAMRETVAHLMLSVTHETPRLVRDQAAHRWDRSRPWPLLAGKTAVIVGVGLSSVAIAGLLKAFGMGVVGVSRTPRAVENFDTVMPAADLAAAAAQADYLINILPGDAHNVGLIGRAVFEAMKPGAYFINVGRGETVDEAALLDVLTTGRIAGAGLDVFSREPLPADSPFWDLPNVFMQPHIGGFFSEYEDYVMPIVIDNMRAYLAGRYADMRNRVAH